MNNDNIPADLQSAIHRIIELSGGIGMAIGALEVVLLTDEFSRTGIENVLARLRKIAYGPEEL